MKYVKTFESHKNSKKVETVNEELLGGVINFFKNLWNKAIAELDKFGENPKQEEVTKWISTNTLNPADDSYMFKQQMDDFKKKPEANDQDCLTLVDGILNPDTGALGKQGLQPMMDALNKKYVPKKGEPMHWVPASIQFIYETIRNKAIAQYKFAGGPADGKIDPKKINVDLKDTVHLPDVKKLLTAATDGKKKKDAIVNWVEKTLIPQLVKFEQAIKMEEIDKNLELKKITQGEGGEGGEDYKVGDTVVYKREKFVQEEWDKVTDDEKKKPNEGKMKELQADQIGIKKISKIEGDKISFEGADFTKTKEDILMKSEEVKAEGQEDLVKKLGELKTKKPDDIKKVGSYVDFISDEANKDKIAEIDKIMGTGTEGGEAGA